MCLGIPGKIISIEENEFDIPMGKVSFGGIAKEVCLAFTPEAQVGDYVIVHVGFALSRLDEEEARQTLDILAELEEIAAEQGEPLLYTLQ
ncbi:MAG: HypC/HybG/HupF family hydrogenase formation chaperone [Anaerolineales bacterium]|nr:HypC/HybG/HupF family hydrogenase formation chaperone [Anaerolineales bacterium]